MDQESRARRAQFRSAEFHKLGRRIGVFASSLLMEAASAGSFPPLSWLDLSGTYTGGSSIATYFDLVAGTSTGGILALGLGAGYSAGELLDLYVRRGWRSLPSFRLARPLERMASRQAPLRPLPL